MKLFPSFFACMAMLLLFAMCGVEGRGSMGGGHKKMGLQEEKDIPKEMQEEIPEEGRAKREVPRVMNEPPEEVPQQFNEAVNHARLSRQVPPMPPMPNDMPMPGK